MNVPIEIFNHIFRYTNDPCLIVPFRDLLYQSTIDYLLSCFNIKEAIICGDIGLIKFMRETNKYDCEFNDIGYYDWINLTSLYKLSNSIILEFSDYVNLQIISRYYDLSDDDIVVLSSVLDWDIISEKNQLSETIILLYINKYLSWHEIFRYQQNISDDLIRYFINKLDPEAYEITDCGGGFEDLQDLISSCKLTSIILREYIHIFNIDALMCIIEYGYGKKFYTETYDLVDWADIAFEYHMNYFALVVTEKPIIKVKKKRIQILKYAYIR